MTPQPLDPEFGQHVEEAAERALPLDGLDPLVERAGDARIVLIGEASHGTAEYYEWRARLTRRLVAEHGFDFVAVEGDWPDCRDVDRWVKTDEGPDDPTSVLETFERWPTWMWANHEVADFIAWLRDHNRTTGADVGFYGLDVYSLRESLDAISDYLAENAPQALPAALQAFDCFDVHGSVEGYARAQRLVPASCEDEVVTLLQELRRVPAEADGADRFDAEQNAFVLRDAERYYRIMVRGGPHPWNLRDTHMADTLDRLLDHHGPESRGVVWEHNTHVGDARFTDMAAAGMVNVGQLARRRHPDGDVLLVGFGSPRGTVVAADAWGSPAKRMTLPPAPGDSHEHVIDSAVDGPALFLFDGDRTGWPGSRRGHRAIGVVYHPERESLGNWVPTVLGGRYDAFIQFPTTEALHPIAGLEPEEIPEGPVV